VARKQAANGIDPVKVRKTQKLALKISTENTFESISREWHTNKAERWTVAYREKIIKTFEQDVFPFIGNRPISGIRSLELLEVFRYANITGRAGYNPAPDLAIALVVPKQKDHPYQSADEFHHFVKDLEAYIGSIITMNATKIVILTGVRTQEISFAIWKEVDLEKGVWEIPAERMKMLRPHMLPLSSKVIEFLKQLMPITGHYSYIFIGRANRSIPISKESVSQVIELLGFKGRATGHGFRHTMSTILHENGFDSFWIEMQLAHIDKNSIRKKFIIMRNTSNKD